VTKFNSASVTERLEGTKRLKRGRLRALSFCKKHVVSVGVRMQTNMKFVYTGIRVRDLKRSIEFYTKTMGMKKVRRGIMRAGGVYVQLRSKGSEQELELNYYPPGKKYCEDYVEGSELDHLAFWCRDVRASYKKVLSGGGTSAIEPWDEGGFTLAFVKDPDGVWIELIGKKIKSKRVKQRG
jgi:lactoylglutathione lyase